MAGPIEVVLNQQQCEVVAKLRAEQGVDGSDSEVVKRAFLDYVASRGRPHQLSTAPDADAHGTPSFEISALDYGNIRESLILEPVTGIALPVYHGEVLRIVQEEDGGQCVDFNAFNLDDYKEHMDAGRTRAYNGIFPTQGGLLYTNSPRDRAMFSILSMPSTCRSETVGARCSGVLFERSLGFPVHTNCQDTLAAAIGAYGLTPDDVHDSFNIWMNTEINEAGQMRIKRNTGAKGDYVDLLAIMDTLSVPVICGSGDVFSTSNFALKPIRVEVYGASQQTIERAREIEQRYNSFRNNRTVDNFEVREIKADRPLRKDPHYRPTWVNFPLRLTTVAIDLSNDEYTLLEEARKQDIVPGRTDGEIVRACVMLRLLQLTSARGGDIQFVFPDDSSNAPGP